MSRFKSVAAVAAVMVLIAAGAALATPQQAQEPAAAPVETNVTGEWVLSMEMGDSTMTLKQEGAVISGTLESPQGALDLEGEIEGNEIVFWGYVDAFTINFYATIEENKSMVGQLEAGDGEFVVDFTAVRIERG